MVQPHGRVVQPQSLAGGHEDGRRGRRLDKVDEGILGEAPQGFRRRLERHEGGAARREGFALDESEQGAHAVRLEQRGAVGPRELSQVPERASRILLRLGRSLVEHSPRSKGVALW